MSKRDALTLMRQRQAAARAPSKRLIAATQNFYAAARDMPQEPVAKERAKAVPYEHIEQVKVIKWWRDHCADYGLPEFALFAIPNAGKRSLHVGEAMRAEGMRRGAPDLILALARQQKRVLGSEYVMTADGKMAYCYPDGTAHPATEAELNAATTTHGLFIEMKRVDGGVQNGEQKEFAAYLDAQGYRYALCHGADAAIATIKSYMEGA